MQSSLLAIDPATCAHPQGFGRHGPRLLLLAAAAGKVRVAGEILRQGVDANAVAMLPARDAGGDDETLLRPGP